MFSDDPQVSDSRGMNGATLTNQERQGKNL